MLMGEQRRNKRPGLSIDSRSLRFPRPGDVELQLGDGQCGGDPCQPFAGAINRVGFQEIDDQAGSEENQFGFQSGNHSPRRSVRLGSDDKDQCRMPVAVVRIPRLILQFQDMIVVGRTAVAGIAKALRLGLDGCKDSRLEIDSAAGPSYA
jgi:hypothetical protein